MSGLFRLDAVTVAFDATVVLADVTVTVPDDGLTVVVGPSGSGKSTLLRLLNRLEVPTAGMVSFRGSDVAGVDVRAHRRRVGMVFQRPTLFAGTVAANLRVADPTLGDDDVAALLTRVGLDPTLADQDGDTLSGGEAQRACLARTLATVPEVVLMDEPTSALDARHRGGIEQLARSLVEDGTPVVWVSHDTEQVARIADNTLTVVGGRVEGSAP